MQGAWFTPRTARRAASRLEPLARELCESFEELARSRVLREPEGVVDAEYFDRLATYHRRAAGLRAHGVVLRDPARGWFEFPARRRGRPALLCWWLGAPVPAAWREARRGSRPRALDEGEPWDDPPP